MDLKQLRYVVQVAGSGSFSAASAVLNVAQPALSRQIQALEGQLGVQLFHRTGRGVLPTAAGQVLVEEARAILARVDEARRKLSAFRGGLAGGAIIGLPPTVGRVMTMVLTRYVREAHPLVNLQIVEGFSGTMVEWLRDGRIDLAILYDIAGLSTVQADPIVREGLCLVSDPASAPDGVDGAVSFDVLATHPLVLPTLKHSLRKMVADGAHLCGVSLDIAFEIDSLQSMIDATRQGLGWTVLPRSAIRNELEAGGLHALPIVDPPLCRTLVTATAAQRGDAVLLHELSRLVREQMLAVAEVVGWRPLRGSGDAARP